MTARQAAAAMARGLKQVQPDLQVDCCPIADGGEGTVDALLAATNGEPRSTTVTGPLGAPVDAAWGLLGPANPHSAVIEMAAAAGLALVPRAQRNPQRTTTYGVGELLRAALDANVTTIYLGIGGSATTDGGIGMAQALGARFTRADGKPLTHPLTGGDLPTLARLDCSTLDPRLAQVRIVVACDVTNPLTGPRGAAAVYGPQKGATPQQVQELDAGLAHLARLLHQQLGRDIANLPGSGAAGGLGGGLVGFLNAQLTRGIDLVLEASAFRQRVAGCALCLTGEGRIDGQSLSGKACLGVAQLAQQANVPTVALVGCAAEDADATLAAGLRAYRVIAPDVPAEESMRRGEELLEAAAARAAREFLPSA